MTGHMGDSLAPDSHDQALRVRPAFRPSIRFRRGASWQGTGPGARRWGPGAPGTGSGTRPGCASTESNRGAKGRAAPKRLVVGIWRRRVTHVVGHLPRHSHNIKCRVDPEPVSYTHLRAHETRHDLVCRL